ncbi:hypothetical protein LINPERPRIM_LOCUS30097 [Linum perenne]
MATLQIQPGLSAPALRFSGTRASVKPVVHLHLQVRKQASLGLVGGGDGRKKGRGWSVVRRAGPSTSSYVFAFALPLSLLIFTIFTSIRISDKLDEDYLEEVIKECYNYCIWSFSIFFLELIEGIEYAEDEDENIDVNDEEGVQVSPEEEEVMLPQPALSGSRIRNRPKRQV